MIALPHLVTVFNGDFNAGLRGQMEGIALPTNGALFLLLLLVLDDGGEDTIHRAATGIISSAEGGKETEKRITLLLYRSPKTLLNKASGT